MAMRRIIVSNSLATHQTGVILSRVEAAGMVHEEEEMVETRVLELGLRQHMLQQRIKE